VRGQSAKEAGEEIVAPQKCVVNYQNNMSEQAAQHGWRQKIEKWQECRPISWMI